MRPLLISMIFLATVIAGCSAKTNSDKLPASLEKLISQNSCICQPFIKEYQWRGMTIYLYGYSGIMCDWFPTYYTKTGTQIRIDEKYSTTDFFHDSKYIRTVWSCPYPGE